MQDFKRRGNIGSHSQHHFSEVFNHAVAEGAMNEDQNRKSVCPTRSHLIQNLPEVPGG